MILGGIACFLCSLCTSCWYIDEEAKRQRYASNGYDITAEEIELENLRRLRMFHANQIVLVDQKIAFDEARNRKLRYLQFRQRRLNRNIDGIQYL